MSSPIADLLTRHRSWDGDCFTWSCSCGVDFHDVEGSHLDHVARVLHDAVGTPTATAADMHDALRAIPPGNIEPSAGP
jgi:hypothetical protein